jgi:phosphoglycerate kinase
MRGKLTAMLKMTDLDLSGKRVLIRVDLNVPLEDHRVTSTKRIDAIIPTIELAVHQGAKVILISHLGRPKEGQFDPNLSLAPVADCLSTKLNQPVSLVKNFRVGFQLEAGQVVLLENIRFEKGEKENSQVLAQELANLCDIFVMDAFATAHRKEASTYGVAEFANVACAGPLLISEINALRQIMHKPARPLVAIVGGSKVSTKLAILTNILKIIDCLIVGGGIANTFLVAKGYSVGESLYEPELLDSAREMLSFADKNHQQILLPVDVVVGSEFSKNAIAEIKPVDAIGDEMILDVGPKTSQMVSQVISSAKTVLWNGPLGVFEWEQFEQGTKKLADAIAKSSAYSVAGGGDTLAAIEKYHIEKDISYISTGGGAFLEFLEGKQLPAVDILERRNEKVSLCEEPK